MMHRQINIDIIETNTTTALVETENADTSRSYTHMCEVEVFHSNHNYARKSTLQKMQMCRAKTVWLIE